MAGGSGEFRQVCNRKEQLKRGGCNSQGKKGLVRVVERKTGLQQEGAIEKSCGCKASQKRKKVCSRNEQFKKGGCNSQGKRDLVTGLCRKNSKRSANRKKHLRVEVATHRERGALSWLCRRNRSATGRSRLRVEVATHSKRGGCTGFLSDKVCKRKDESKSRGFNSYGKR